MNTALRADLAEAAAVVLTGQINLAEATTSLVFAGRHWTFDELPHVLSNISGRTITHREADEDEGTMTMIGPAVRAGVFEHQTDDLGFR
jgi:hypothetical protein